MTDNVAASSDPAPVVALAPTVFGSVAVDDITRLLGRVS